jgi:hypothetical protein
MTAQYLATGTSVWNFDELKEALLWTSYGKCAYCECRLSEESKYVEVEHFFCSMRSGGRTPRRRTPSLKAHR